MLASIRSATKIYGQHKALNKVAFELAEGDSWRIAIDAVPEAPGFVDLQVH